ncbi:MAG: DNRLRE domain-containing protein [Pseudomonadota bacterium]
MTRPSPMLAHPRHYVTTISLLTGILGSGPVRAQDIQYGPWLQDVRVDGISVLWRADEVESTSPEVVVTSLAGNELARVNAQSSSVNGQVVYTAQLSGLQSGTRHLYSVHSGATTTETLSFRTAPAAGSSSFRFYVAGDSRSDPAHWGLVAQRILEDLEQDPDRHQTVLLHTGDLVADGSVAGDWDQLWPPARELLARLPMYTAFGNHEDRNTATSDAFLYGYFSHPASQSGSTDEKWFALDYADLHVATIAMYDDTGYQSGPQNTWLSADLAGAAQLASVHWRIGLVHFAPWSLGGHVESEAADLRATLHPLYRDHGVPLVLGGHNHLYARYEPVDGVAYVTSGGGGAPLHTDTYTPWSGASLATSAAVFQFLAIDVEPGAMTLRAVDSQGQLFDVASYGGTTGNRPPAAVAGPDQRAQVGDLVTLDGSGSVDPEAVPLTFGWTQRSGPTVVLDESNPARPQFLATRAGRVQFHLRVSDGQHTSPPDLVQIEVSDQVLVLDAIADTFVDSATPDTNNGSATVLQVDDAPSTARAYLRFVVPPQVAQVQRATLRLFCVNAGAPPSVRTSPDLSWAEDAPTWNQAPAVDAANRGALPAGSVDAWSEVDITPAVVGSGPITLVLIPTGGDGADFESREGAHPPQLVIAATLESMDAGSTDSAASDSGAGDADAGITDAGSSDTGPGDVVTADSIPRDAPTVDVATGDNQLPDLDQADQIFADAQVGTDTHVLDAAILDRAAPDALQEVGVGDTSPSDAPHTGKDGASNQDPTAAACGCSGAPGPRTLPAVLLLVLWLRRRAHPRRL